MFVSALSQPDSLFFLLARPAYNILWLFAPVCFGIAILRFHRWDIDLLINRALVYDTLTALMAGVYFGIVMGAQSVVRALTGQSGQQPVLIVITTLLIAALFDPLRRRLQALVDQRFYRSKVDAARTVEAFAATLRPTSSPPRDST